MKYFAAIVLLGLWVGAAAAQTPCLPETVPLVAGGSTPVGTVTVTDTSTNLLVTYATTPGTVLTEVRLAYATTLAGIPQGSQGPALDKFPFAACLSPGATSYTFVAPLPTGAQNGTPVYIVAFAVVSTGGKQQTAWGAGLPFPHSPACTTGGGKDDDDEDDDHHDGEHDGGDSAHSSIGPGHNSGHEGDHHEGDDDGDHEGDHEGGQKACGLCPSGSDHHDDHHEGGDSTSRGGSARSLFPHNSDEHHNDDHHDNGDDGGDHGGKTCVPCGATYFVFVVNCIPE